MGGAGLRPARSRDASPRAARSRGRRRTGPSGVTRMRRDGGGRTPCSRPLASAGGTPEAHRHGPTTGTTVGPPAAQAVPAIPEPCARCRQSGRRRCHRPVYSGEPPGSETCLLRPDRQGCWQDHDGYAPARNSATTPGRVLVGGHQHLARVQPSGGRPPAPQPLAGAMLDVSPAHPRDRPIAAPSSARMSAAGNSATSRRSIRGSGSHRPDVGAGAAMRRAPQPRGAPAPNGLIPRLREGGLPGPPGRRSPGPPTRWHTTRWRASNRVS